MSSNGKEILLFYLVKQNDFMMILFLDDTISMRKKYLG